MQMCKTCIWLKTFGLQVIALQVKLIRSHMYRPRAVCANSVVAFCNAWFLHAKRYRLFFTRKIACLRVVCAKQCRGFAMRVKYRL